MVEEREVTPILKVEGLTKVFDQKAGKKRKSFKALDDVSFSVQPGKTLGIVGESGCGKSTLGRVILRLLEPTAGQAWLNGENIFQADPACLKRLRRNMQIIFQDPYASLDQMCIRDRSGSLRAFRRVNATVRSKRLSLLIPMAADGI